MKKTKHFNTIGSLLGQYQKKDENKYISREFQSFGLEIAEKLGDTKRKALYIKLAKETPRGLLESALSFVLDADSARNKAALFMWKLKQLKDDKSKK